MEQSNSISVIPLISKSKFETAQQEEEHKEYLPQQRETAFESVISRIFGGDSEHYDLKTDQTNTVPPENDATTPPGHTQESHRGVILKGSTESLTRTPTQVTAAPALIDAQAKTDTPATPELGVQEDTAPVTRTPPLPPSGPSGTAVPDPAAAAENPDLSLRKQITSTPNSDREPLSPLSQAHRDGPIQDGPTRDGPTGPHATPRTSGTLPKAPPVETPSSASKGLEAAQSVLPVADAAAMQGETPEAAATEQEPGQRAEMTSGTRGSGIKVGSPVMAALVVQIKEQAPSLASGKTIHIRLDPPDMGSFEVRLELTGTVVRAVVATERADTLDLLVRHRDALVEILRDSGFDVLDTRLEKSNKDSSREDPMMPIAFADDVTTMEDTEDSAPPSAHVAPRPWTEGVETLDVRV